MLDFYAKNILFYSNTSFVSQHLRDKIGWKCASCLDTILKFLFTSFQTMCGIKAEVTVYFRLSFDLIQY